MKRTKTIGIACCVWFSATTLLGQSASPDRVSVPLRDPSSPGTVKVSVVSGGIEVKGYDGKEVIVEARARSKKSQGKTEEKTEGLKRIEAAATGLSVEEENNIVTIGTGSSDRAIDLTIQVPFITSLTLRCQNDGDIVVEKVVGEIEANNLNGAVTLTNVEGVVVAHSLNRKVLVQLSKVTPDKPMSFSSMNGDIDVTLPAEIKANVKLETQDGRIESDFEIGLTPRKPTLEDDRKGGGKYRIVFDKGVVGTINGGGAEILFKTVTGKIYIRKGAK